jgi:hypothetical protein
MVEEAKGFSAFQLNVAFNPFETEGIIAGDVIKSSIVVTWARMHGMTPEVGNGIDTARAELSKFFWAIRFTHAFPAAEDGWRPVVPPRSMALICRGDHARLHPRPAS